MTAYSTPPTFASPWQVTDANTYIRDNFVSCRTTQSSRLQAGVLQALTTTPSTFYTSPALASPLTEVVNLQVYCLALYVATVSGAPTSMSFQLQDQAGSAVGPSVTSWLNGTTHIVQLGGINVSSGTTPQFKIRGSVDAGSANWLFIFEAWVSPTTT